MGASLETSCQMRALPQRDNCPLGTHESFFSITERDRLMRVPLMWGSGNPSPTMGVG